MSDRWQDPDSIPDVASFQAALRAMRSASGLTYRQLERRAARVGHNLPNSTISGALARGTLPRPDLLTAFVRACGGSDEEVARWSTARARLAAAGAAVIPAEGDPPAERPALAATTGGGSSATSGGGSSGSEHTARSSPATPDRDAPPATAGRTLNREDAVPVRLPRAGLRLVGVAVAVILLSTAVVLATRASHRSSVGPSGTDAVSVYSGGSQPVATPSDEGVPGTSATGRPEVDRPLPGGRYRIRLAHTGLCVGEGKERFTSSGRTVLGQHDCAKASPPILLEWVSARTYRIKLDPPTEDIGCATVDYGAAERELLLAGAECADGRADQRFVFEAVNTPAAGYRIRSEANELYCIGVYRSSVEDGTQLIQDSCVDDASQVFTFTRN